MVQEIEIAINLLIITKYNLNVSNTAKRTRIDCQRDSILSTIKYVAIHLTYTNLHAINVHVANGFF